VRDPASAILSDAQIGLPRVGGRDHLIASEAASLDVDQAAALQTYTSWGWVEESTRSWESADKRLDAIVLLSLRPEAADVAYEHFAQAAEVAPYEGSECPSALTGLDACRVGVGAGRTVVTGRLSAEVFVLDGSGIDVVALAALQATRLRSP
jgi:hypothetical protein